MVLGALCVGAGAGAVGTKVQQRGGAHPELLHSPSDVSGFIGALWEQHAGLPAPLTGAPSKAQTGDSPSSPAEQTYSSGSSKALRGPFPSGLASPEKAFVPA